jgi:hypothetical protein
MSIMGFLFRILSSYQNIPSILTQKIAARKQLIYLPFEIVIRACQNFFHENRLCTGFYRGTKLMLAAWRFGSGGLWGHLSGRGH